MIRDIINFNLHFKSTIAIFEFYIMYHNDYSQRSTINSKRENHTI